MVPKHFFLISLFFIAFALNAQEFHLLGDAQRMDNGCILLTPDEQYREGIAYCKTKLNLENYFDIEFDIFLGDKEEGADGITFVIHNDPRGFEAFGTWGECMGYGRWSKNYVSGNFIAPSIAIEFDTYQNLRQNDPSHDHVAYLEDGTNYHEDFWHDNNLAFNLEDNYLHSFRLKWNPENQELKVYLDGQIVYQGKKDLLGEIFQGNGQVIWGFTASTGRKHNLQYFCLKRWAKQQLLEEQGDN